MRLVFKPSSYSGDGQSKAVEAANKRSLLLYSSEFALFLDDSMSRIELQYLSNAGGRITRVMGSRDVKLGEWNELVVIDANNNNNNNEYENNNNNILPDSSMFVRSDEDTNDEDDECDYDRANSNKIILVIPNKIELLESVQPTDKQHDNNNNNSNNNNISGSGGQLFVAGLPESLWSSDGADNGADDTARRLSVALASGYRGCIRELSINGRRYKFRSDLNGDALDGFDVGECLIFLALFTHH